RRRGLSRMRGAWSCKAALSVNSKNCARYRESRTDCATERRREGESGLVPARSGHAVRQRWPELVRARSAPKRRGRVRGERGVVRDDREALLERLRDEKAVERIAVVGGQRRQTKRVRDRDRQLVESRPAGGTGDRVQIGFDLAERRLDGDLPG